MRQLIYSMFITNNHDSFHLWWHQNFVKHQNVSKYYGQDCIYFNPLKPNSIKKVQWTTLWWLFQVLVRNDYPVWLYVRYLYQLIDWINWLTRAHANKQLFFNLLHSYDSICPNLSCLDIFMVRWWWTNS